MHDPKPLTVDQSRPLRFEEVGDLRWRVGALFTYAAVFRGDWNQGITYLGLTRGSNTWALYVHDNYYSVSLWRVPTLEDLDVLERNQSCIHHLV